MKKILIVNQPTGNRGDQAAHYALIRLLKEHSEFEVNVLFMGKGQRVNSFYDGIIGADYHCYKFPRMKSHTIMKLSLFCNKLLFPFVQLLPGFKQYSRYFKDADVVLCAPGGICMGTYRNWLHVWNLSNALYYKKQLAIYSRSIGPFPDETYGDKVFTKRSLEILKKVSFVSLRDKRSQEMMDELQIKYVPSIDTAFAYQTKVCFPEEYLHLKESGYVVFVPNKLYGWHPDYVDIPASKFDSFYRAVLEKLLETGLKVVMLPQLFGQGDAGDYTYFKEIASKISSDRIEVVPESYNSDIQQAIIGNAEMLIGSRYHSIIFAINNHVPFLCMSYEHKMFDTLRLLDLSRYSFDIKDLVENEYSKFLEAIDNTYQNRVSIKYEVTGASEKANGIARKTFVQFISALQ